MDENKRYKEALSTNSNRVSTELPVLVTGDGCWVTDTFGKKYFDATSGSGALNLGHQHPYVMEKVQEQMGKLSHTGCKFYSEARYNMIQKLGDFCPFDECSILPAVTGAEAVEASMKVVRAYTNREGILAFKYSFHGKTAGAVSLSWNESLKKFSDLPQQVYRVEAPQVFGKDAMISQQESINNLKLIIEKCKSENNLPAALIMEPIQITEGMLYGGTAYVEEVIRTCRSNGILVVLDEIYTGFGRTGSKFYSDKLSEKPDILLVGKSLANGFPMSAVVGKSEIIDSLPSGVQTSTFSGHPISSAAASAVIDVMNETKIWKACSNVSTRIFDFLHNLEKQYESIQNVRGEGMLFAFDCADKNTGDLSPKKMKEFIDLATGNGMLVLGGGFNGSTIKIVPPLVMNSEDEEFLLQVIKKLVSSI